MDWLRYTSVSAGQSNTTISTISEYASRTSSSSSDERRRQLIEGVIYSGRLILTYQLVMVSIVLLFTIRRWLVAPVRRRLGRLERVGHQKDTASGSSSSSSSTLAAYETSPETLKHSLLSDERSHLLLRSQVHDVRPGFMRVLRSVGMWQPSPLPVTKHALPSSATTLLVCLLLGINVFYALYNISFKLELSFVFSDRTARLFVANLPWLYLLAAKNQPLRFLTGYSYENLNILHRRLGEILCFLAVLHGVFMIVTWYLLFRPAGMDIWHFLSLKIIVLGLLALASYEILFFTSLASFREWWYEMFLASHIILQAAGLILVYFHHSGGRIYTGIALAIFLIDRVVFRLATKTSSFSADLAVMADGDTVKISADWPVTSHWSQKFWTLLNTKSGWQPTEHVFLTVPAMAKKHIIQAHPFTIASAAPEGKQQYAWFNLLVRAHDGFTRDLLQYARTHSSAMIRVDGPYGSLHALEMMRDSDVAVAIVGGSGIAVAYPLLWTLLHDRSPSDSEATPRRRKVALIWIIHEASHISWIGQERLDELKAMGLHVCVPGPTSMAGRPDAAALVRDMIHRLTEQGNLPDDPRVGVVVSGPDGMNRAVRNTCASLAWQGWDVDVAVEKYGW